MGGPLTAITREDILPSTEVILGRIIMVGVGATANSLIKEHLLISSGEGELHHWRGLHLLSSPNTHPLLSTIVTKS